ncbi:hypothetical protein J3Q64DRAFT_1773403 [Phycomyces blakesleeanus]|uniref:Uncharacterized protein n=1 Tax=Phycomyces blakesleeanus TaxID=4837 RepID=A0ABR3AKU1_PHYBL
MSQGKAAKEKQHQDPLLTPGHIKQVVKALPSKIKHPHDRYKYQDTEPLKQEIDEFFNYSEAAIDLPDYRREYNRYFGSPWKTTSDADRRSGLELLIDQLEYVQANRRISAAKQLVYISLGCLGDGACDCDDYLGTILANNQLLYESGALPAFYQALRRACAKHDALNQQSSDIDQIIEISIEIELYLSLLYLLIESRRQAEASWEELASLTPSMIEFLFSVIAQLREKYVKSFPYKKLILLLWKVMLAAFGGLDKPKSLKEDVKKLNGFQFMDKDIVAKCTPLDLYNFQNESVLKYPAYTPPKFPFPVSETLTIKATSALASAMGISSATANTDLPYQALFPPKQGQPATQSITKKQSQINPFAPPQQNAFALPLTESQPYVPKSISEAGNLFVKNMHMSLSTYQIIHEREKAIHKWQNESKKQLEENDNITDVSEKIKRLMNSIEHLYHTIMPELQNIIIVLLKLLLSTVTNNSNGTGNAAKPTHNPNSIEAQEEIDATRNREIISKAISAIILLLLKWTKLSHVLKHEYLSQLLVDSGCLLLILKILGLQEITALVAAQTDRSDHGLFHHFYTKKEESSSTEEILYTNQRNMFWSINFLRILQMLTKRKTNRVMLLVQYKSSAILKRMLKVSHPVLELYTLKVLKSQVPYLGRRWKSLNMKIISAIYLQCHTALRDDWISKIDTDTDLEDGMAQEINLRILIRMYNGQHYMPSMLPQTDDTDTLSISMRQSIPFITEDMKDNIELDPEFMENYEKWLYAEVYDSEDDTEVPEIKQSDVDTPLPSPILSAQTMPDTLAMEIQRLYLEELNQEFNETSEMYDPMRLGPQPTTEATFDQEVLTLRLQQVEKRTVERWTILESQSDVCI